MTIFVYLNRYSVDVDNMEMKGNSYLNLLFSFYFFKSFTFTEDSDSGEDNGIKEINLPECSELQGIIAKEEEEHEEEQEEEIEQDEVDHKEENEEEEEITEHPISLKCINCSSIGPLHR